MDDDIVSTGKLERTDRAYREDLELAMGTDIRRAIIELVTNADDSYTLKKVPGEILVEVEHRRSQPKLLEVSDNAEGMTLADIKERLAVEGAETSGFAQGIPVRGFFGRGGRDVVHFGPVSWTTWKGGEHHEFALTHEKAASTKYQIKRLAPRHPRKSGTVVRLEIRNQFTIPRHSTLLEDLGRHYALRPILVDGKRSKIFLRDRGKQRSDELRYLDPNGKLLESTELSIKDYSDAIGDVRIYEAADSLSDGKDRPYWRHSLLITSEGAAYDVFPGGVFAKEPDASHLARLYGTVDIPKLASLIREFDDRERQGLDQTAKNPTRIVRRDRTGLAREHPFVMALYEAIENTLRPHITRLQNEAKAQRKGQLSEKTEQGFSAAGKIISKFLDAEDAQVDGSLSGPVATRQGLSIIPSSLVLEPNTDGALTIQYRAKDGTTISQAPTVYIDVTLQSGRSYRFSQTLKERNGYFSKGIIIAGEKEGEVAGVHARVHSSAEDGTVRWKRREHQQVDTLQWHKRSYVLAEGKKRKALLYAPWQIVSGDEDWHLTLEPPTGITLLSKSPFMYDYDKEAGVSVVELMNEDMEGTGKMIASVGDQTAPADLRLNRPNLGGLQVKHTVESIPRRAWLNEGEGILWVNFGHPVMARLLGKEDDGWPGQREMAFQSMLAELLAVTVVRHSMARNEEYSRDSDINSLFSNLDTKATELAGQLHEVLLDRGQLFEATHL